MKRKTPKRKNKTSFQKGNKVSVGNKGPSGKPQYDREELANKKIDQRMVSRYITLNSHLTADELRYRLDHERVSIFEERIIKSLLGEDAAMPFGEMVNRVAGKVPDVVEHKVKDKYDNMSDEELLEEKKRLSAINRVTLQRLEQEQKLLDGNTIDVTNETRTPSPNGESES